MMHIQNILFFLVVTTALILVLIAFIIATLFFYRKKQITYYEMLSQLKLEYEKNLLSTQIEIQEETFQHISREIHDNISLSLTLAKLHLNTINWKEYLKAENKVHLSLEQITKALDDLSNISKSLNSEQIINQGLLKVLDKEITKIKEVEVFQLDYSVTGTSVFMDAQKELIIFRIIQEAFNNIIKHAKATEVILNLHFDDEKINIYIFDNGQGFCMKETSVNINKESKAGLINMQRRAAIFNGKTKIDSIPGKGTTILVTIPF